MPRIGLFAGEGDLPLIFAQRAKERGQVVIGFGLKGITSEKLENCVDKFHWIEWGQAARALTLLAFERINKVILLGKLRKDIVFKNVANVDEEARKALSSAGGKKDYALFNNVAGILSKVGIEVIDSTTYLEDMIAEKGILTSGQPSEAEWDDINYGEKIASVVAGFDIGQTVIVKDRTVIAIEAVEGTDAAIARAGALVGMGFTVVKHARPEQDMRFDVPLVGIDTIKSVIKAGGKVLALQSGKMFLADRGAIKKEADENKVSVVII